MSNICERQPKDHPTPQKIPQNHLYISICLWTRTGELETRPRRAETYPGPPYPKKTHARDDAPTVFCEVDASRKRQSGLCRGDGSCPRNDRCTAPMLRSISSRSHAPRITNLIQPCFDSSLHSGACCIFSFVSGKHKTICVSFGTDT